MMKVFIDTNIMVDVLLGRKEFLLQSSNIFQLADNEDVELYATALTFVNALYVSRIVLGKETALKKLKAFHDILKTAPMGDDELSKALLMDNKDMEDNLQYRTAVSAGCEVIVTRNVKDFPADGEVRAMLPGDFLDSLVEDSVDEDEEAIDDDGEGIE